MAQAQEDQIGLKITVQLMEDGSAVDVSWATTKSIILQDPSGTNTTKTATFTTDGTDGKIYYDTTTGDLSTAGRWKLQPRVLDATRDYYGEVNELRVIANL